MSRQEERSDAVAGGLLDGREGALDGGAACKRRERNSAVRGLRHQPQDCVQVAGAVSAARRGGTAGTFARAGGCTVGDKRGAGGGDHGSAAGAPELGTQEAARQA